MSTNEKDVIVIESPMRPSVLVALAVLHAMSERDAVPHVFTITDPHRDGRTREPARLPYARERLPRALSPAAQQIVDDIRARKVANKLKTAALCRTKPKKKA